MPAELAALLDFAQEVAVRGGVRALAHFQTALAVETKDDLSPVTIADREAERVMRAAISERFPHDGILGEEYGEANAGAARRWILDPIDGTRSFTHGVPLFGVMVALEVADRVELGVLHFPALNETVAAARGLGCSWNGRPARVSTVATLAEATVLATDVMALDRSAGWKRLASAAALTRTWGDCYGYALVATGRAEVMVDPVLWPWDVAALVPVIEEAGGVLTDWRGERGLGISNAIATNAALADAVRELLIGELP